MFGCGVGLRVKVPQRLRGCCTSRYCLLLLWSHGMSCLLTAEHRLQLCCWSVGLCLQVIGVCCVFSQCTGFRAVQVCKGRWGLQPAAVDEMNCSTTWKGVELSMRSALAAPAVATAVCLCLLCSCIALWRLPGHESVLVLLALCLPAMLLCADCCWRLAGHLYLLCVDDSTRRLLSTCTEA
jgi:hypothetical protein